MACNINGYIRGMTPCRTVDLHIFFAVDGLGREKNMSRNPGVVTGEVLVYIPVFTRLGLKTIIRFAIIRFLLNQKLNCY
jgi:hypothetical protein